MQPQLHVTIQLHHPRWKTLLRPYGKTVRAACAAAWGDSKLARVPCHWEMTVVLADDAFIRQLNHEFRGKDAPTNVLSFPDTEALEKRAATIAHGHTACFIGDMVLALETIEREALEQNKYINHHVNHLLVHGILHLLGYDHEDDQDAARMEKKEIKILKTLGVENPYL